MGKSSFKDWLTEQTKNQPSEEESGRKKQEWLDAIEFLYAQLCAWLREDDPDGVIKIWSASEQIAEAEFGAYSVPSLRFVLRHRMVSAIPIARNVIGPARSGDSLAPRGEGRVDLTAGSETIHLYRVRDSLGKTRWVIVNADQFTYADLDKAAFEDALQRLFSCSRGMN